MTAIVWERVIASMQQNRPSSARINRSLRSSAGSSSKRDGNTDQFDHDTREMETANVERTKRRDKRLSHTRAGNERRGLSVQSFKFHAVIHSNGRIFSATNIFTIYLCRERICWTSRYDATCKKTACWKWTLPGCNLTPRTLYKWPL